MFKWGKTGGVTAYILIVLMMFTSFDLSAFAAEGCSSSCSDNSILSDSANSVVFDSESDNELFFPTGDIKPIECEIGLIDSGDCYSENDSLMLYEYGNLNTTNCFALSLYEDSCVYYDGVYGSQIYDTEQDCYGTYYYYNKLNDNDKKTWDALYDECTKIMNDGSYMLSEPYTDVVKLNGFHLSSVSEYDRHIDEIVEYVRDFEEKFKLSNPQFFFLSNNFYIAKQSDNNGGLDIYIKLGVFDDFIDGTNRIKACEEFYSEVDSYVDKVDYYCSLVQSSTESEKTFNIIKAIQRVICEETSYVSNQYDQCAYSVFCLKESVCAGYSDAFALLCNYYDIDCISVVSSSHAWNMVRFNDNWYNVDTTWADQTRGILYLYFMCSTKWYEEEDPRGNQINHMPQHNFVDCIPIAAMGVDTNMYIGTEVVLSDIPVADTKVSNPNIKCSDNGDGTCTINIACDENADIFYTLGENLSPKEAGSKSEKYESDFIVDMDVLTNIRIIAVKDGYLDSDILSALADVKYEGAYAKVGSNIVLTPVFDINGNVFSKNNPPYIEYVYEDGSSCRKEYSSEVDIGCPLDPNEMGDMISATFYAYDVGAGEYKGYCSFELCFADYANELIETSDNTQMVDYVKNLLLYGGAVQVYTEYKTDELVSDGVVVSGNANINNMSEQDIILNLQNNKSIYCTYCGYNGDIDNPKLSITLNDAVDASLSFSVRKGNSYNVIVDNVKFLINDDGMVEYVSGLTGSERYEYVLSEPVDEGSSYRYYISVENIYIDEIFDYESEVTVSEVGTEISMSTVLNVSSYMALALQYDDEQFERTHDIIKYLYMMSSLTHSL